MLTLAEAKTSQTTNAPKYDQQGMLVPAGGSSTTPQQQAAQTTPTPTPTNQPITTPQQQLQAAQASGAAPQTAPEAKSALQQFAPQTPTFYKPTTAQPGFDAQTVFDSSGKPLSYDQFIQAGGKKDFSNVTSGMWPTQQQAKTGQQTTQAGNISQILKSSAVDEQLASDPAYQQLLTDQKEFNSLATQGQSLVETYQQMTKDLGIPALNTQLMDMKNVIDGSEDDIRAEVTKAGGFATESQVAALTNSRNKQLIKNYNNLLQTKQQAQDTLNTMVGLAGQDRQFAMQTINQKLQIDEQIANYRMKMQDNAQNTLNKIVDQVGYAGLASMTGGDPYYTSLVEKTLGLAPGGLTQLASYKKPLTEIEQADLAYKKAQTAQTQAETANLPLEARLKQAQIANIYSEIKKRNQPDTNPFDIKATPTDIGVAQIIAANPGQWGNAADAIDKQFGAGTATKYDSWLKAVYQNGQQVSGLSPIGGTGTGNTPDVLAQNQANVTLISDLLKSKGLDNAVGPNSLSRSTGFLSGLVSIDNKTGATSNFVAGVQQLVSQLTLDSLIRAKKEGATFGALSEGELNALASSATKLNSWAIKDNGQVVGYNASEKDFKKELDKINNFAKLDYILKGGNYTDVGVQKMPDGTYWTQNSDGSMTQL